MDQHIDGIALHFLAPAVQLVLDLPTREDRSRMFEQRVHQRKFSRGQGAGLVAECQRALVEIQAQGVIAEAGYGVTRLAPQHRSNTGEQFADFEGLEQVIVCANIEAFDAGIEIIDRGEDQHRHRIATRARGAQQVDARHARQADIEQHDGVLGGAHGLASGQAVAHPVHGVVRVLQCTQQALPDLEIVFDQQDSHTPASGKLTAATIPDWPSRRFWITASPPYFAVIAFTMDSPRPVPSTSACVSRFARKNRSKTRGSDSSAMPGPVSVTSIHRAFASRRMRRSIVPPSGVYRTALLTRFLTAMATSAPEAATLLVSMASAPISIPRAAAIGNTPETASTTMGETSVGSIAAPSGASARASRSNCPISMPLRVIPLRNS